MTSFRKTSLHYKIKAARRHVLPDYERDEMTPSINVANKLAGILNTTVGYPLDETEQENVLKDPDMLKRLNDIQKMGPTEKGHGLFALDALIQKIKIKNIVAL